MPQTLNKSVSETSELGNAVKAVTHGQGHLYKALAVVYLSQGVLISFSELSAVMNIGTFSIPVAM